MALFQKRSGSILTIVLIFVAGFAILFERFIRIATYYEQQSVYLLRHEQAKLLALNGLTIAKKLLEKRTGEANKKIALEKESLRNLLAILNTDHQFILTKDNDGIDGTIQFFIECEEGKIDLNHAFDKVKKTCIGEYAKLLQGIVFEDKKAPFGFLFQLVETSLKKIDTAVYDLGLVRSPFIQKLSPFTQPVIGHEMRLPIRLTSLFTTWGSEKIYAVFLSFALCQAFKLQPFYEAGEKKNEAISRFIDSLQEQNDTLQLPNWTVLKTLYKVEPVDASGFAPIISFELNPETFLIVVKTVVEGVVAELNAVVKREYDEFNTQAPSKQRAKNLYKVVRLSWER